jgi:hypothetical protein
VQSKRPSIIGPDGIRTRSFTILIPCLTNHNYNASSHFRSQLLERTLHLQVASCHARYTSCAVSHHTGDYPELLQSHIILILSFRDPKIQRLTRIYSAILVYGTNSINQSLPTQILLKSACCPVNARTHLVRNTCIILSLSRPKITLNS